ncbi:uncharacterized protein DSM5745_06544 [Aspergillus mulundensis]|uniref:Uncharacterized protein n=1 Tax=Aspergillus mulundensis TaxID=1810919 RepID=A0A3D8RR43_9EURO|nr:hypothetical protein DSM5745_06544 [Aspergillus mulundensis]RDW76552.1 hypothetical protein DSM5745_06544 [Aspergillus mulundensis]
MAETADFFSRFPGFTPNPSASIIDEFERLARHRGWSHNSRRRKHHSEWIDFAEAEFDRCFGAETKLESYQNLCQILIPDEPAPPSITQCRKALKRVYVNLIDLIDAVRMGTEVPRFRNIKALRANIKETERVFPRMAAKKGVLKELLREIW